jgi:hypothetical protein
LLWETNLYKWLASTKGYRKVSRRLDEMCRERARDRTKAMPGCFTSAVGMRNAFYARMILNSKQMAEAQRTYERMLWEKAGAQRTLLAEHVCRISRAHMEHVKSTVAEE